MVWFPFSSFFRKNKPEPAPGDSGFYSSAEDTSGAARGSKGASGNQKASSADPVLPEKKRARRRLVGAIALTLGLVIVLPMVLDSEPKTVSNNIVIQIPSRDKPASLSAGQTPASVSATAEKAVEPPATPAPVASSVQAAPVVPSTGKKSGHAEKTAPAIEPVVPKAREAEPKPADKTAKKPAPEGAVTIQVAALATQQKVRELQLKLAGAGIKSQTQKVATQKGERIRVRIGPFASRNEAQRTCVKLGKMRLNCTILPN